MNTTITTFGIYYFLILILTTVIYSQADAKYSISGISSGGFMAAQMGVIYSADVEAVGIVAAGFYNCAGDHYQQSLNLAFKLGKGYRAFYETEVNDVELIQGHMNESIALSPRNPIYQSVQICMKKPAKSEIDLKIIADLQSKNLIAPTENIKNQKVFLYQGGLDHVVNPEILGKNIEFYEKMNVPQENIKVLENPKGAHTFPTDKKDLNSCSSQGIPYISSCGLDLAGEILKQALGKETLVRNSEEAEPVLFIVKQSIDEKHPTSVADYGYMATPPYCLENPEQCKVHVALHGCEMSDSFDQDFDESYQKYAKLGYLQMRKKAERPFWRFYLPVIEQLTPQLGAGKFAMQSGYLDYVNDENKLMVLFPQTWITEDNYPGNPKGCWDWYGWTGSDYKTNEGQETKWLHEWITRVAQDPTKFVVEIPMIK